MASWNLYLLILVHFITLLIYVLANGKIKICSIVEHKIEKYADINLYQLVNRSSDRSPNTNN